MTAYVPPRYPAGHPEAGKIIIDDEEADESPDLAAQATAQGPVKPSDAARQRSIAELLPASRAQPTTDQRGPALLLAVVGAAALICVMLIVRPSEPTGAPAQSTGSARPTAQAGAQSTGATAQAGAQATGAPDRALDRAVVAYDAPDGRALGAIDAGRTYTLVARAGDAWAQIAAGESGTVWVRARDLGSPSLTALPDLRQPTAAPIPPPAPAPAPDIGVRLFPSTAVPCTEQTAGYRTHRTVYDDGGVPLGAVVGWSCVSQADADANAAAEVAAMREGK